MNVTVRIIDYKALRRSYAQWRAARPAIAAWYHHWMENWISRETENA